MVRSPSKEREAGTKWSEQETVETSASEREQSSCGAGWSGDSDKGASPEKVMWMSDPVRTSPSWSTW